MAARAGGLAGVPPADAAEEEAMLAAAMKLSLEQAASDAVSQPGDPAVAPTSGLLGLFAAAASAAGDGSESSTSLRHLVCALGDSKDEVELGHVCVGSDASYYYYGSSGEADRGWGCAYRCAQMIVDSVTLAPQVCGSTDGSVTERQRVLSIEGIQRVLATLDERSEFGPDKIGSTTWIEPPDVAAYLLAQHGVECVQSKVPMSEPAALDSLCIELWQHFNQASSAWRPPVMIDDTMFAYCIGGVATTSSSTTAVRGIRADQSSDDDIDPPSCSPRSSSPRASTWLLVLDPHVSDPQLDGQAPSGVTLAHFRTPPAAEFGGTLSAAHFKSTAPLPRPDRSGVVRWLRFDEVLVEGCRSTGWMVCR